MGVVERHVGEVGTGLVRLRPEWGDGGAVGASEGEWAPSLARGAALFWCRRLPAAGSQAARTLISGRG